MNIIVKAIPHKEQRYPTCGDWWFEDGTLQVRVSEEIPEESQRLVVLHELAEVFMYMSNGITQNQVDEFDMNFEANRHPDDESEPGDHPDAPYGKQHAIATGIERIVCAQMGVVWVAHEAAINDLFKE